MIHPVPLPVQRVFEIVGLCVVVWVVASVWIARWASDDYDPRKSARPRKRPF